MGGGSASNSSSGCSGVAKTLVNCCRFGGRKSDGGEVIMMGFFSELEVCLAGAFLAKLVFQ